MGAFFPAAGGLSPAAANVIMVVGLLMLLWRAAVLWNTPALPWLQTKVEYDMEVPWTAKIYLGFAL